MAHLTREQMGKALGLRRYWNPRQSYLPTWLRDSGSSPHCSAEGKATSDLDTIGRKQPVFHSE